MNTNMPPRPPNPNNTVPFIIIGLFVFLVVMGSLVWVAASIAHMVTGSPGPTAGNPITYFLQLAAGEARQPGIFAYFLLALETAGLIAAAVFGWRRWSSVFGKRRVGRLSARQAERDQSSIWAKGDDVRSLEIPPNGDLRGRIYLGELLGDKNLAMATPRFTSVAVIAPTGAAKTAKYVVPTILRWSDALFVTSTKSDVTDLTIEYRTKTLDRPAYILDPTGDWPPHLRMYVCAWSPLMEVDTYADAEKVAQWLAESANASSDPKIRFLISLTQIAMAPLLWIARKTNRTMQDISDWFSYDKLEEVADVLDAYKADNDLPPDVLRDWVLARRAIAATLKRNNNLIGNIYGNADFILRPFVSAQMAPTTEILFDEAGVPYSPHGRPVLDMRKVLREGGTIYAVSDEEEQEMLLPVFVSVTQSFLRACRKEQRLQGAGPLQNPPLLLLEEAANVAPLPTLDKMAATYRGFGIVIMSIWQDEAQIANLYGTRAATVLGNHTTRVYLPGSSDDLTLDRLSRLIGDEPVADYASSASVSTSHETRSLTEGTKDVRVAPIEYLRTLPANVAVMLSGRLPPMRVTSLPWFQDPDMRRRIGAKTCEKYDRAFAGAPSTVDSGTTSKTQLRR